MAKSYIQRLLGFFLICTLISTVHAQVAQLQSAVNELDRDPDMRAASWSICVMDAQNSKLLLGHHMHKSLATASVMKVVTTATALSLLGANYQFETVLEHDGELTSAGILNGNLYIRGGGDPSLGSHRLENHLQLESLMGSWAKILQQRGIKAIRGRIIGDASCFDTQLTPEKWPWEDMGNYYGAGASGLNIHENFYSLDFRPGKTVGASTSVLRTQPFMSSLKLARAYGVEVEAVDMDAEGADPESLEALLGRLEGEGRRPKYFYTVPTFQNPSGRLMSLARRRQIIHICARYDVAIVEDNAYGELSYDQPSVAPLYSLAPDRVIFVHTFSKIFGPGIRLGWIAADASLIERASLCKVGTDQCSNSLTQRLVLEYGRRGYIEEQVAACASSCTEPSATKCSRV